MVWIEKTRFRVRDEKGGIQIVVEMMDDKGTPTAIGSRKRAPSAFYFLLDGQDVRRASDDTFVNLSTGEILVLITD